ncbi:MAG: HEAT repeat domain-containing protein [Candidatus Wallbacteria bacterium]|nr:HEAT repeat domain-containing protein [Candidatus Wallbacteria bacterium]
MTWEELKKLLADPKPETRKKALDTIALMQFPDKRKILSWSAQNDPNPDLQQYARRLLSESEKSPDPQNPETILIGNDTKAKQGILDAAISGRVKLPKDLLKSLIPVEEDPAVLSSLLILLGQIGGEEGIPLLAEQLKHQNPQVRASAIEAFGLINNPVIMEYIAPFLQDPDSKVKAKTAESMLRGNRKRALESFEQMVVGDDSYLLVCGIEALKGLDDLEARKLFQFAVSRQKEMLSQEKTQIRKKEHGKSTFSSGFWKLFPVFRKKRLDKRETVNLSGTDNVLTRRRPEEGVSLKLPVLLLAVLLIYACYGFRNIWIGVNRAQNNKEKESVKIDSGNQSLTKKENDTLSGDSIENIVMANSIEIQAAEEIPEPIAFTGISRFSELEPNLKGIEIDSSNHASVTSEKITFWPPIDARKLSGRPVYLNCVRLSRKLPGTEELYLIEPTQSPAATSTLFQSFYDTNGGTVEATGIGALVRISEEVFADKNISFGNLVSVYGQFESLKDLDTGGLSRTFSVINAVALFNSKPDGIYISTSETGSVTVRNYTLGLLNGEQKEFYPGRACAIISRYEKGRLIEAEKFNEDGTQKSPSQALPTSETSINSEKPDPDVSEEMKLKECRLNLTNFMNTIPIYIQTRGEPRNFQDLRNFELCRLFEKCPAGGEYILEKNANGSLNLICSIHGQLNQKK